MENTQQETVHKSGKVTKSQTTKDYGKGFWMYFFSGIVIGQIGAHIIGGVIGDFMALLGDILLLVGLVDGIVWIFRKVTNKP